MAADERRSDVLAKTCSGSLQVAMAQRPQEMRELTQIMRAVYHLEQAADLCVCIAEEAVFFHSGRANHVLDVITDDGKSVGDDGQSQRDLQHDEQHRDLVLPQSREDRMSIHGGTLIAT